MPPLQDLLDSAVVVSIPMKVTFRSVQAREALLLRGPQGWAEFSPFVEYDDGEAAAWLRSALAAGWEGFPPSVRDSVPVNATMPAVSAEDVPRVLANFDAEGTVKIKVAERGQNLADDLARVRAVRQTLPEAKLRVDANGGWGLEEAEQALSALAEFGLEYAEQPVGDIPALALLRQRLRRKGVPVLIAADESVRKESDPLAVARAGAADILVVKAAPLGGVQRALAVVAAAGLPAVVSSALDTSIGMSAGLALAAALPQLDYACGLGTISLMAGDVAADSLVAHGGFMKVRSATPEPELLARFAATPARTQWWMERLSRTYALL
ncbi:MAG: o-succinylbenzoate synthase [Acidobacteria bacterium]|nr:o-succinylbenzoate synthase [Acidobacteriota bacterium]